jgi:hypothetical protein
MICALKVGDEWRGLIVLDSHIGQFVFSPYQNQIQFVVFVFAIIAYVLHAIKLQLSNTSIKFDHELVYKLPKSQMY